MLSLLPLILNFPSRILMILVSRMRNQTSVRFWVLDGGKAHLLILFTSNQVIKINREGWQFRGGSEIYFGEGRICMQLLMNQQFQNNYSSATKTSKLMYKATPKMQPYPTPHRSPSPINASTRQSRQPCSSGPKIDLRQFNDYLQQRISRSALKKEVQMSRRELSQKRLPRQPSMPQITRPLYHLKPQPFQNSKESRLKKSRDVLSPLNGWRKHESIENLLGKENNLILNDNRKTESQSQQSALRQLQRKYQQLQQKYKKLMKEAAQNAREFERDKQELTKMKEIQQDDQGTLNKLRKELCLMHQNMKVQEEPFNSNQNSLAKVKSEAALGFGNYSPLKSPQPVHEMWKNKLYEEAKIGSSSNMRMSRNHKTQENWTKNIEKNSLYQSEQKNRPQKSRYYSAEKVIDSMRRSKVKKNSDHTEYPNTQSKTSIKFPDSVKNSRVKVPAKPVTETLIRFDHDFTKSTTPTTLHKKMITSKPYSKYRFQPTFKIE